MELSKIREGIEALTNGGATTAAEMVDVLREETVVLKAISHTGSFNPFSYTMNELMRSQLSKGGASESTLKKVKGWKIELPKKEIGPFWAIIERVRFYARSRCISGTSHLRAKELNELLEVVKTAREEWQKGKENLEAKWDGLKKTFLETAEESLGIILEGEENSFLRDEFMKDVVASIPNKDEYLKRVSLIVDIEKPDGSFAFFDPEDAKTIDELSEEATKRQLLNITQECCQNILSECSSVYVNIESCTGGYLLTTRQVMQFDKACKKAAGDNVLSNPVIAEICDTMNRALDNIRGNDYASAQAECEDVFLSLLQFEEGVDGIDLAWGCCPIKKDVLATMI